MRTLYATARRLKLVIDKVKDPEMKRLIEFDIKQTRLFGVIYLAESCQQIKVIENLGFKFRRSGKYYVLPEK